MVLSDLLLKHKTVGKWHFFTLLVIHCRSDVLFHGSVISIITRVNDIVSRAHTDKSVHCQYSQ